MVLLMMMTCRFVYEQEAAEQHVQKCRADTVAMKAGPIKHLLMEQLMPVLTKAMVEATEEHAADPVQFVAQKLLEVSMCAACCDSWSSVPNPVGKVSV